MSDGRGRDEHRSQPVGDGRLSDELEAALARDRTIDITTIGSRSGRPRRVEIWFHNLDGTIYITGSPGRRDWYANLLAHPEFEFHLKHSVRANLAARAHPITDPAQRREVMAIVLSRVGSERSLDHWVAGSPLVQVEFLVS